MITGIIVNDYRNNHRRCYRRRRARPPIQKEGAGPKVLPTKKSTAPNPKEVAGLHKMMGWWFCEEVLMMVVFGEGKGEGGSFGGVVGVVVVLMEMEEEEDEGRELERLEWLLLWWR